MSDLHHGNRKTRGSSAGGSVATAHASAKLRDISHSRPRGWKAVAGTAIWAVLLAALLVGILAAIGVRFGSEEPAPVPAAEAARQDLAVRATRLADGARQYDGETYAQVASHAAEFSNALGGVWEPWPTGAPAGTTNPPLPTSGADLSTQELAAQALDLSDAAIAAANGLSESIESAPSRPLYLSIALRARLDAQLLAEAAGTEVPACEANAESAGALAASSAGLEKASASREWIETATARLEPAQRNQRLPRINVLTTFEEGMVGAGIPDSRMVPAAYPTDESSENLINLGLENYAEILTGANGDARELVNFGCSLYLDSAERSAAPALPGLANERH